ncbi:response regulator [Desulfuromonas carbonis]|uniref:hybrid sensor histidine kinase/response regulator n=1 Tax=Desulfuromonas sp. DDH964 TaxID=1823759 RepID=UPI00078D5658|nr:ATP-binding protein [Desulfuromonas sp. DDH964]AMV72464.1 response receiver sensor histidine kinase, PAS domain-containing [Desulfuromonas sp. DDH964]
MAEKVLVVDDDRFMRELLTDLLQQGGFEVALATNGEEGISRALAAPPDVILLDLVMPVLDGIDACRALRANPLFRHTPILMMTSRVDLEGAVNPFQVGADDYLSKPFDQVELLARVQGSLAKRRAIAALEQKARDSEALLEISGSVTSTLDTVEILRQIVQRIAGLLSDVYRCSIALIQEDEQFGYVLASSDDPGMGELRIDLEKYPEIRQVIRSGEPLLIKDIHLDPILAEVRPNLAAEKFNTILVLPVRYQERVIGAMVVRALRSRAGISRDEVAFCQLVANVSANSLKNAHHFALVREESDLLRHTKQRLEKELAVKAVYEMLFENASEGLAAFNRGGKIVYINRKGLEIIGYSRAELETLTLPRLLDIRSLRKVLSLQREGRPAERSNPRLDVTIRAKGDQLKRLSISLSEREVVSDLQVVAFRDVTERRVIEQELKETKVVLEQANERLKALDRSRAEFLNTAAHELRIPVTIVSGYCSLLKDMGCDNLSAQQREFLDAAVESSDRLVDLISNILDLSRLNAGKMQMDIGPRDLSSSVHEVYREVRSLALQQGLELDIAAPDNCLALFDDEKIKRVLFNLVGNAIKFTAAGGRVRIEVSDQPAEVIVSVSDTGKGVPAERLPELFEEFTQALPEDSTRGSGLGLSICRKIVESHNGRIWAESRLGEGSRFHFSLPRSA